MDRWKECRELKEKQSEHIRLAVALAEDFEFTKMDYPYCYVPIARLVFMAATVILFSIVRGAWNKGKRCPAFCWLLLLPFVVFCEREHSSSTMLNRLLTLDVAAGAVVASVVHPGTPTPALERARQIFLAYPTVCEDLKQRSALQLVMQIHWRELQNCYVYAVDHPSSCQRAHRAAYTAAAMLETDLDAVHTFHKDFLNGRIETALKTHFSGGGRSHLALSQSDRMRGMADQILRDNGIAAHHQEYRATQEL